VNKIAYATSKQVVELIGLSNNVNHETLGTGDSSNKDFNLDNENVIADSYTIYYGVSGSNSFTDLTETTDYSLDKPKGKVSLTSTGVTKLGTKELYVKYVWCEPFTDTEVSNQITFADAEANKLTGRKWDTAEDFTEYFDYLKQRDDSINAIYVRAEDTSEYYSEDFIVVNNEHRPLASVTKIEFYDKDGTEDTTAELTSANYPDEWEWYTIGKIVFKDLNLQKGYKKIKVTGTYGLDETPVLITELSSWLTGLRLYMNLSGGSYNDVTSYSLGGDSISVGEPYINIREFMVQANKRIEQILSVIGVRQIIKVV